LFDTKRLEGEFMEQLIDELLSFEIMICEILKVTASIEGDQEYHIINDHSFLIFTKYKEEIYYKVLNTNNIKNMSVILELPLDKEIFTALYNETLKILEIPSKLLICILRSLYWGIKSRLKYDDKHYNYEFRYSNLLEE
jgi:hypothetical protein